MAINTNYTRTRGGHGRERAASARAQINNTCARGIQGGVSADLFCVSSAARPPPTAAAAATVDVRGNPRLGEVR